MIGIEAARRFVAGLPWPDGAEKPFVRMWGGGEEWSVILHEKVADGWRDIANVSGPTPEGALRYALEKWLSEKGLNNEPAMYCEIRKLVN